MEMCRDPIQILLRTRKTFQILTLNQAAPVYEQAGFFLGLLMGIGSELRMPIRLLPRRYAPVHQAAAADNRPYAKGMESALELGQS
jgi:hypothetical protein